MSQFSVDTRRSPKDENWAARRAVASRLRVIVEALSRRELSPTTSICNEALSEVAGRSDAAAAIQNLLSDVEKCLSAKEPFLRHFVGIGIFTFECSAWTGHSNPLAPPLELWSEAERVHARVEFSKAYEESAEAPWVHRGYVAAAFDHVLGYAQMLAGEAGMTARLQVTHFEPVPSCVSLRIESWVTRIDGRRKHCLGQLFIAASSQGAAETLAAEAEGVFVVPPRSVEVW